MNLTSTRPYLLRALYEWIVDNHLTPYVLVDATAPGVVVPAHYVKEGKIVLNISPAAVRALVIHNEGIGFGARFGGTPYEISVPIRAVRAIYAQENGKGMVFPEGEEETKGSGPPLPPGPPQPRKPRLKLVK
jgi:stringent starvation protein B